MWALNAALAAGAYALYHHVAPFSAPDVDLRLPWWALAIGFALTEVAVVHVHFRRSAHTLTLAELPLVLGLLFAAPGDFMHRLDGGRRPRARAQPQPAEHPPRLQPRAAGFHRGDRGRALPRRLRTGRRRSARSCGRRPSPRRCSRPSSPPRSSAPRCGSPATASSRARSARWSAMAGSMATVNASLGLAAGAVIATDPRAGVLLLSPAAAVFLAYRAYTSERRQHANLEFLHEASRTLSHAPDTVAGLAGLLAMALETFRGELAEVCLFPVTDDVAGRRIAVGAADRLEVMQPLDDRVATRARRADRARSERPADHAGGGRRRARGPPASPRRARARCSRRCRASAGSIGAMLLANRLGTGAGSFARADLKLFQTLSPSRPAPTLGQDQPDEQGRRAARAAGRARAPGLPRPAHRARQPPAVHEPRRTSCSSAAPATRP